MYSNKYQIDDIKTLFLYSTNRTRYFIILFVYYLLSKYVNHYNMTLLILDTDTDIVFYIMYTKHRYLWAYGLS